LTNFRSILSETTAAYEALEDGDEKHIGDEEMADYDDVDLSAFMSHVSSPVPGSS
jgi:hypothetical protein